MTKRTVCCNTIPTYIETLGSHICTNPECSYYRAYVNVIEIHNKQMSNPEDNNKYGKLIDYKQPVYYIWSPRDDITALELAKCIPLCFARSMVDEYYESLPIECKRHWIRTQKSPNIVMNLDTTSKYYDESQIKVDNNE